MSDRNYSLLNVLGQYRFDIKADDLLEACTMALALLYDRDQKWEADESTTKDGAQVVHMSGINKETGKKLFIIVAEREYVESNEVFSPWELVN